MRASSLVVLALVMLAGSVPADAQVPFGLRTDCHADVVLATVPEAYGPPWPQRHPSVAFARLLPYVEEGRWGRAAASVVEAFRQSNEVPPGALRASFQAQMDSVVVEMRAVEEDVERVVRAGGVNQSRFRYSLFDYVLFPATGDEIDLAAVEDPAVRRDLCWRAITMGRLLMWYGREGRSRAVDVLDRYLTRWEHYNAFGYAQYPWELLANGLRRPLGALNGLDDLAPPRSQLVLLHPSLGVEVGGDLNDYQDWRRLDVLLVEPLGYLRYDEARTRYWGASVLVSIPADAGPGFGGLLHGGRLLKLGYVWRDEDEAGRGPGVVFTVDLLQLVAEAAPAHRAVRSRAEALRDRLSEGGE